MLYVQLFGGLALLFVGGELLVRGAVGVARRLGLSPLLIGLVLVGFGTSMPELVASVEAARAGSPGIAIGNVVGSNVANILLILGLAAAIRPVACSRLAFVRDGTVLVGATGAFIALVAVGHIGRGTGALLLALLVAYAILSYASERRGACAASAAVHRAQAEAVHPPPGPVWQGSAIALVGMLALLGGAAWLIESAVTMARSFGISETVIGLSLVAIGTSLPELATSVIAALRGHDDIAFGNIVGSCIFNVLGILGAAALMMPIPVPPEIRQFDAWAMSAAVLLLGLFAWTGWRIRRWEGWAFLVCYVAYLGAQLRPETGVAL